MQDSLTALIDAEHLPKPYGGELHWSYEDEPSLDDHAAEALGEEGMPKGPVIFVDGNTVRLQ